MRIIDASDPSNPISLTSVPLHNISFDLTVASPFAYVANYSEGVAVFNVSNVSAASLLGIYDLPRDSYGVTSSGNFVLSASFEAGLLILCFTPDAALISHTIPPRLAPGQSVGVGITFHNSGCTTWENGSPFTLAVLDDPCSLFGGLSRISVLPGIQVGPDQTYQFLANLTAPNTERVCTVSLQMIDESVENFGPVVNASVEIRELPNVAKTWTIYE